MSEKIRVLVIEPGKNPEEREIDNTLEALQEIVGGPIQVAPLFRKRNQDGETIERIDIVCNEEGKIMDLPANRVVKELNDIIVGTFLLVSTGEEDFIDMTDEEIFAGKMTFRIYEEEETA